MKMKMANKGFWLELAGPSDESTGALCMNRCARTLKRDVGALDAKACVCRRKSDYVPRIRYGKRSCSNAGRERVRRSARCVSSQ